MEELQERLVVNHVKAGEIRGGDIIAYDGRVRVIVLLDRAFRSDTKLILKDSIGDRRQVIFNNEDIIELLWRDRQGS